MGELPGLQIVLELALGTSPVRGRFRNASGNGTAFVGWQELNDALDRAVLEAVEPPHGPNHPRPTSAASLRAFEIRLVPGSEPVRGHIQRGSGPAAPFTGWLELATILDQIRLEP